MENVWLTRDNENVWTYRIGPNPNYLSKSKMKLFGSILLCIVLIIASMLVWSLTTALLGALIAIFILPLLEVITVLAYSIALLGKKEEVTTINRVEGKINTKHQRWRAMEEKQDYQLQDFTSVKCSRFVATEEGKRGKSTSSYFVVSLHGSSSSFEIFCIPDKDAARTHCRELAAFLKLEFIDEIKSY